MDRARYLELRVLAEKKLECGRGRLKYQYLGEKVHLLKGCGREARYLIFRYYDVWVKIESFHKQASFKLKCNVEKLEIKRLDEDSWEVSGCGQSATYELVCEEKNRRCAWVG
ncbi:MAG: hypothetical protein GY847_03980 [Proteobacteria bacterium]|nr:hypothetical protein [Pseudomonadota bacterium]